MTDRFDICLPYVLAQECPFPADWDNPRNFSDLRGDPGGATMCGITHREYDFYRKHRGEPTRDVRAMTQEEGHDIYRSFFWEPWCGRLPPGLDLEFFDACVNEGTTEAVRILQAALGLTNDGDWGPKTEAAVARLGQMTASDIVNVTRKFAVRREAIYRQTRNFTLFGHAWIERNREIAAAALRMAAAGATPSTA